MGIEAMKQGKYSADSSELNQALGTPDEIVDTVHRVRNSLAAMIDASGANSMSARETARMLGIDRNLVWQVTKIIKANDILAAALDIPSIKRIELLCRVCSKKGASREVIDTVIDAMKRFEHVVENYAGSREAFSDLLQGMVYDDVTTRQEEIRKTVFRGNSSIWGVQARVNFMTGICYPSLRKTGMVDVIRLGGLIGFKRLRPVPWSVFRMITHFDDGSNCDIVRQALDPAIDAPSGLPLMADFCTDPLPEIETIHSEFGKFYDLKPGPIGKAGLLDIVFGDFVDSSDQEYWRENDQYISFNLDLHTPSEVALLDLFFHEKLRHVMPPEVLLADRLSKTQGFDTAWDERHRLPLSSQVRALPPGTAGSANTYYPDYPRLLEYSFEQKGLNVSQFRGFRFTMKYPITPSALQFRTRKTNEPNE